MAHDDSADMCSVSEQSIPAEGDISEMNIQDAYGELFAFIQESRNAPHFAANLEYRIEAIAQFDANYRLDAAAAVGYKYQGLFGMICWAGDFDAIKLLEDKGADVNKRQGADVHEQSSFTPLMICAEL